MSFLAGPLRGFFRPAALPCRTIRLQRQAVPEPRTCFAKCSKESPSLDSAPSSKSKKQLGTSLSLRFFCMHGAQPLACLVGCSGHAVFLQEQNALDVFTAGPLKSCGAWCGGISPKMAFPASAFRKPRWGRLARAAWTTGQSRLPIPCPLSALREDAASLWGGSLSARPSAPQKMVAVLPCG